MNDRLDLIPAALYARVSSDRQDVDLSVSAQLRVLRDYAERNGYLVAREYVDEAESGLGTVVNAGTGHLQQSLPPAKAGGALPHYRQLRVFPVHHLPPARRAHGPDLFAKKSRSTFSCPISWYSRATRAASFLAFCSLPLPKTPARPR